MQRTNIGWTHWSVNPFKMRMPDGTLINVCVHKSGGCARCYAESILRRYWKKAWSDFPGYTAALLKLGEPVLMEEQLDAVLRLSLRISQGKADPTENKVFWNDMTDEFLDFWPDDFVDACFAVRLMTPNLIHQVLTKRADRMLNYFETSETVWENITKTDRQTGERKDDILNAAIQHFGPSGSGRFSECEILERQDDWPIKGVHLGISAEDHKTFAERWGYLRRTPAAVRWISFEPLLGEIRTQEEFWEDLDEFVWPDWCVIGGESGSGHREMNIEGFKGLFGEMRTLGIPIFVKQDSGPRPGQQGRIPDEYWLREWPK